MSYDVLLYSDAKEDNPVCFEKGDWDGERSGWCVVIDKEGLPHMGRMYSGYMDGFEFNDWYDQHDMEILNVVRFASIIIP